MKYVSKSVIKLMKSFVLCRAWIVLIAAFFGGISLSAEEWKGMQINGELHPLVKKYCLDCHNDEKEKGDISLQHLEISDMTIGGYDIMQLMQDSLESNEMPPEKAKKHPSAEERDILLNWITSEMNNNQDRLENKKTQTILRRLNTYEYRRSVEDLLRVDTDTLAQIQDFPEDQKEGNYTNDAKALLLSSNLLDAFARTGDEVSEVILSQDPSERPQTQKMRFKAPFITNKSIYKGPHRIGFMNEDIAAVFGNGFEKDKYQDIIYSHPISIEKFKRVLNQLHLNTQPKEGGAPVKGYYTVSLRVKGMNSSPKGKEEADPNADLNPTATLRLELLVEGSLKKEWVIKDDEYQIVSVDIWLDKGQTFQFRFPQGVKGFYTLPKNPLVEAFGEPEFPVKKFNGGTSASLTKSFKWDPIKEKYRFGYLKEWVDYYRQHYPTLRISDAMVEGPIYTGVGGLAYKRVFGENGSLETCNPVSVIRKLGLRAFRGFANNENLGTILAMVADREETHGKRSAIKAGIMGILSSPWFIYLLEETDDVGRLTPVSFANRLSYFLWGTVPDKKLVAKARSGALYNQRGLRKEIDRMVASPKLSGLIKRLVGEWLNLNIIGEMPPSRGNHPLYYTLELEKNSKIETRAFMYDMIRKRQPIKNFIDTDYVFVNRPLAELYNMEGMEHLDFNKVKKVKNDDPHRGGLLGQASILIATADGAVTSPIMRGLWILRSIFGDDVNEPPPGAQPVEVDLRHAATLRSQLEAHRKVKSCASCHKEFDHLGFPLENYNVIGQYRKDYIHYRIHRPNIHRPVDAKGQMPTGEKYNDVVGMKKLLLTQPFQEKLAFGITRSLMTLACGRKMTKIDELEIQRIVDRNMESGDCRFNDLLYGVLMSDTFVKK